MLRTSSAFRGGGCFWSTMRKSFLYGVDFFEFLLHLCSNFLQTRGKEKLRKWKSLLSEKSECSESFLIKGRWNGCTYVRQGRIGFGQVWFGRFVLSCLVRLDCPRTHCARLLRTWVPLKLTLIKINQKIITEGMRAWYWIFVWELP